jgi:hypothetical protein
MKYKTEELQRGAKSLRVHVRALLHQNPELGDFHEAFEQYCARKFSLGNTAARW